MAEHASKHQQFSSACYLTRLVYTSCQLVQERLVVKRNKVPQHAPQL
jgi:hypothetical protein